VETTTQPKSGTVLILVLVLAAVWFSNLGYRKLIRPDEGRYAEIAREMAVTGDWVTPRLNGIKYFEKPPLQYWATAAAFRAFGLHEWTARLWPAVTGFLGVLLIGFTGARLYGRTAGIYASLVAAGSAGYTVMAHLNTLDMGLAFFMTGTLSGLLLAHRTGASATEERCWMLVAWGSAALAVLSKGLIGVVLPAGVAAIYMLIERDFRLLRRCHWTAGGLLFFALAAPWFVLVQLANPEFARFFFVHEHFQRFLTTVHRRVEPWWYFVPILIVMATPWVTLLPHALAGAWRKRGMAGSFQTNRFLLIWAVFIFAFFSASHSKLSSYILPILPALALLIGARLARMEPPKFRGHAGAILALGAAIIALSPFITRAAKPTTPAALFEAYVPWIAGGGTALLIGGVLAVLWCRRDTLFRALSVLSLASLIGILLIGTGHNALAPSQSGYDLANAMKPHLNATIPIFSVRTYDQTLPFYLRRPLTLVAHDGEMNYGLAQEPELGIPTIAEFESIWRKTPRALAIMEPVTYALLEQRGLPMRIIARDLRRIVVAKPAS